MFGYCPQVDALDDFMTAYESLKFMALLRGLDGDRIDREVKLIMEKTDLTKYADVRVSEYSGGTKRKLNTAMAMVSTQLNYPFLAFQTIHFTDHFHRRSQIRHSSFWTNQPPVLIQHLDALCGRVFKSFKRITKISS